MVKSGLIFGVVALVFILGFAVFVTPFCAPCLGLVLGIAAGYMAGVFDKPANSGESLKKGGYAGAIAGSIGFLGGLMGGVINGLLLNPSNVSSFSRVLGLPNVSISQQQIWISQFGFVLCIGGFDILWMALLGVAGGALWYQISGKKHVGMSPPPQEPAQPGI
jgi:hypothetical protein